MARKVMMPLLKVITTIKATAMMSKALALSSFKAVSFFK